MTFLGPHYHAGFVVPDVSTACVDIGSELGLTWAPVRSRTAEVATRTGTVTVPFTVTYSREGPPYIELIQTAPGTLWACGDGPVVHHLGYWSENVAATSQQLSDVGAEWLAQTEHEDGSGLRWVYHQHEHLGLVEVVDLARRVAVEAWVQGFPPEAGPAGR